MQQSARQKLGIFLIIIGFLILIAIIYFGFFRNATPVVIETPNSSIINNQLPSGTDSGAVPAAEIPRAPLDYPTTTAPHKINGTDVAKIAMAFAERFGSYSNQSSYGNFTDLKIMMTDNMKSWVDKYISDLKASSTSQTSYYGITTKALINEIKKFDDAAGVAQIIVTTNRQESTGTTDSNKAYFQKLDLDFKKVNGEWLVDRAYWEK